MVKSDVTLSSLDERLDGVNTRLDGVNTRLDGVDTRLDGVDTRFDGVDTRLDGVDRKLEQLDQGQSRLQVLIEDVRDDVKKVAEGVDSLNGKFDRVLPAEGEEPVRTDVELLKLGHQDLHRRVTRLERRERH